MVKKAFCMKVYPEKQEEYKKDMMNFGQRCAQRFVNMGSSTIRSILIRVQVYYLVT